MRGEIKSPSGSRSGDHNDGQGIPQKVMGYSVSNLSGSKSGDQCEGTDTPMRCANNNLPGSRSRDHSEGKDKPKDGYVENKLRSGDHNEGQGKSNEEKGENGESKISGFRSGDHSEGQSTQNKGCGEHTMEEREDEGKIKTKKNPLVEPFFQWMEESNDFLGSASGFFD